LAPSVYNIHMMALLVSQVLSSCEYCKQMTPTCSKQMNLLATLCTDIQLILYWTIA